LKTAQNPQRPVHALLGNLYVFHAFMILRISSLFFKNTVSFNLFCVVFINIFAKDRLKK